MALLTHLALLFWVFRTTLTLATPLCYRTTLALLVSMVLTRMLINLNADLGHLLVYRTTLTLLVSVFLTRMLIKRTSRMLTLGHRPVLQDHLDPAGFHVSDQDVD